MTASSAIAEETQYQVLTDLCQRKESGDLECAPKDAPPVFARVRFLELSGDSLLVDHPTVSGQPCQLPPGEEVHIYFVYQKEPFGFTAHVRGPSRWPQAGDNATDALVVDLPTEIKRFQRRECHRLQMSSSSPVTVRFRSTTKKDCGRNGEFRAELADLSETDCGVIVQQDPPGPVEIDDRYEIHFRLPDIPETFALIGRIRRKISTPDDKRIRLGVMWEFESSRPADRWAQQELARFILAEQFRMLRRARSD